MRFSRALPLPIGMTAGQFIAAGLAIIATTVAQLYCLGLVIAAVAS
jgi:hypothetical protein